MANFVHNAVRSLADKCGYRIFSKDGFYRSYLHYNRYGTEPIHILRHFIDVADVRTCIDVGANRGQTAEYFSKVFPSSTIYSFEPVAATYAKLVANTRQLPRVKTFNYALGRTAGTVEIPLADNDQTNTLVAGAVTAAKSGTATQALEVRTLDSFLRDEGVRHVNVLKTDTEGFDLEVLSGGSAAFAEGRIDLVYCEVGFHPDDLVHTYFDSVCRFLAGHNFAFLGLYDTVFCDNPTHILHANALFGHKRSALIRPWSD